MSLNILLRLTKSGVVVGEVERISASTALRSYLTSKGDPAGEVRQVQVGFAILPVR